MRLRRVSRNLYVCGSDDRLHFRRPRVRTPYGPLFVLGWEFHLAYAKRRHHFATLAEATSYARPLWRPYFLRRALPHLRGDGLRLWQDAVTGDRQSFQVLLDWIDDNLPHCRGDFSDRGEVLQEADRCGLFRPRRRRQAGEVLPASIPVLA
jgi:hypothetical protein